MKGIYPLKLKVFSLVFLLLLCGHFESYSQGNSINEQQEIITVEIVGIGFKNNDGQAIIAVFKSSEGFPGDITKAYKRYTTRIKDKKATFNIDLPVGTYAIACIHDENENDALEKNILGIPKEGAGLSNYEDGGFPSYNRAKIHLGKTTTSLRIKINYL